MQPLKPSWTGLFTSNLLGIFNDNLLKHCIIFISIGWWMPSWLSQSQLIAAVSASLVLPYIFLSPLAGRLSVIYKKKSVFLFFKFIEFLIMLFATLAFYYQILWLAVFSVLLMGIASCLYSPSKYGLIRDIGGEAGVSYGSGIFEAMAFLGILLGTVTASVLSDHYQFWIVGILFLGLAILGYLATKLINAEEIPVETDEFSSINPLKFLINSFRFASKHQLVNSAVLGASAFWLIGGLLQMNLIIYCKQVYNTSNTNTGLIMICAAMGIAFGCWVAAKISGNEVKKGLILIGLAGMIVLLSALTFFTLPFWLFPFSIFGVAMMGGFFQVPCLSMIQQANLGRKLGDMIAYLNLVTFLFVLFGTMLFSVTTYYTAENSFAVFGLILIICVLVAIYFIMISPVFWKETMVMIFGEKK